MAFRSACARACPSLFAGMPVLCLRCNFFFFFLLFFSPRSCNLFPSALISSPRLLKTEEAGDCLLLRNIAISVLLQPLRQDLFTRIKTFLSQVLRAAPPCRDCPLRDSGAFFPEPLLRPLPYRSRLLNRQLSLQHLHHLQLPHLPPHRRSHRHFSMLRRRRASTPPLPPWIARWAA